MAGILCLMASCAFFHPHGRPSHADPEQEQVTTNCGENIKNILTAGHYTVDSWTDTDNVFYTVTPGKAIGFFTVSCDGGLHSFGCGNDIDSEYMVLHRENKHGATGRRGIDKSKSLYFRTLQYETGFGIWYEGVKEKDTARMNAMMADIVFRLKKGMAK